MSSELLATYSGLGTYDGENYYKGDECLACVKDLIRALKGDDDTCEIRRQLGKAGILQKDLLSILVNFSDDSVLRNDVIRLLVNLTQPAYLCFGKSYPKGKEKHAMSYFMEVNHYLRQYKEAFVAGRVMQVLGAVLAEMCKKDWQSREDDDIVLVERILVLIRNILHVSPDPEEEKRTEDDVSIHDQIIWNLHLNGIDDLLLFLGSNPDEKQWCMHVLEILFLILREQSPAVLAKTGKTRSVEDRKKDEDAIDDLIQRERVHKQQKICGSRHSRFGGTYVMMNEKSIADQSRIYHRPLQSLGLVSQDIEKRPRRTNKLRRPVPDVHNERCSTYSVRMILRNLCCQFLECCYNSIMNYVLHNVRHNKAMDNDETYYLWALRFMMEFNRLDTFSIGLVGETLELHTLHYVIQLIASYYESMLVEKKVVQDAKLWGQRLHFALQAYKELLLCIQKMFSSEDKAVRDSAKTMEGNILYHPEYRDIFVTLLRNYDEVTQTKSYLRDLIEATHVYIKNMETFSKTNKHIVVMEKRKTKKGRKKKSDDDDDDDDNGASSTLLTEDQLVDLWEKMDGRVADLLQGTEPLPRSAIPFDAASDQPMEEQKKFTMGKIRRLLQSAKHPEAVALFRAAREVWPGDVFGKVGMSVDEEMEAVRSLFVHPMSGLAAVSVVNDVAAEDNNEEEDEEGRDGSGGGGDGSLDDVPQEKSYELEFDIKRYIMRFCHNKVVRAYCLVLRDYRTNQEHINHAVIKMLFRIAVEMKMAPLLYQLSVFRTMQAILHEPAVTKYAELQKFCRYIVSGFFAMASTNPLLFAEILFWKTTADVDELTEGYGAREREIERKQLSCMWTREQEEELAQLYERFKGDEDVVACIEAAISTDVKRTRKQIVSQLVSQHLIGSRGEVRKKQSKKKAGEWSEEELIRLKEAFEPHEDPKEAIRIVSAQFPDRGIRDVAQQLKLMNLISEKKARKRERPATDHSESDEESIHDGSSIKSTPPRDISPQAARKANKARKKHKSTPSGVKVPEGSTDLRQLVVELHRGGYSEQLAWLEAYLRDEANDRAVDDEWEDMCIVPVSEELGKAMQMQQVQEILAGLNMQPPSQQEVYWRIPSRMSPDELKCAADLLVGPVPHDREMEIPTREEEEEEGDEVDEHHSKEKGLSPHHPEDDGTSGSEHCTEDQGSLPHHSESEEEDKADKAVAMQEVLKQLKRKRTAQKATVSEEKEEEEPEHRKHEVIEENLQNFAISKRPRLSRKAFLLDDDTENDDGDSQKDRRTSPDPGSMKKPRKLLDSDCEDDDENDCSKNDCGQIEGCSPSDVDQSL